MLFRQHQKAPYKEFDTLDKVGILLHVYCDFGTWDLGMRDGTDVWE